MTTVKTRAARALSPLLSVFHSISGQPLQAVWQIYTEGSLDRLILDFGSSSLVVIADENDDSIDCKISDATDLHKAGSVDASHLAPWNSFVGKSFGWGWVTINQQGYCDGLLLSFEGIIPQLALNVMASSIKVGMIARVSI
ncbi:MAG: hypothetical protein HY232_19250 [Acidobacteria bacterium]|nr:hypothetical protein [Acidobacteriota bacterium]